jgi:hypothetical protein
MDDKWFAVIVLTAVLSMLGFFGALTYFDHVSQMKCMEARGTWARGSGCIFR